MGKTYCIVPKKRRMLQELLCGMELATDEETHLAACTILHVEIDPAANGWEIVLQTQSFLQPGILTRMATHIRERCGLTSVVFYQQVIDIVQGIDDAWDTLAERVAAGNQAVWTVLERATHTVADGKLVLELHGEASESIMRAHDVAPRLAESIHGLLGYRCGVTWETLDAMPEPLAARRTPCARQKRRSGREMPPSPCRARAA